ncbi:hypothetical protein RJZ56_005850 [Blastomyces dermatitidis]|uniref:RING-type domain-containing protein n=3 Tax=Blastomyces TaxID=229219 RepID=A0A179UHW9_BLAGS|nr:uncharacterized protein BDBG_03688 [Blastomyces gilchristii SLH14081]XP_045274485.1 uncharacterized protein BDCG_02199 [Blastomyces dermatitidis ER-3]EGE86114.1 hypothetical protein BDDG_09059 [Blastomyces dermatitidis ATCC 18188]EQL33200.1 hypothetical protein BDFG_04645 [Blastomyces dermatitidis ATCC 26199]EEQ87079.1 hypothetical protein BDCG_02199 [Blastomyces dermatitidis ER-3]OAT07646.1 hypothetical protein BDBG_03688 [Blastomyces gilchristii SLH14081]
MSTVDDFLQQMSDYLQGAADSEATNTSCGICSGPFFLPFHWSPESPHSFCLECLWNSFAGFDSEVILACPLCRCEVVQPFYNWEVHNYMELHGIQPEQPPVEQQKLLIAFLFIRISSVDDEVMWDVDLREERMQTRSGSPITVAAGEPGIPAILLAAMTATIGVYKSLEDLPNRRPEDRWITALLNLRDQIPMEIFRSRMQGIRFVADVIQLTLEDYMPGYQSW